MKLNLGAGRDVRKGFVNVDRCRFVGIDVAHDLNNSPWPFEDDSAEEIVAIDVIEHLACGLVPFLDEAHRVLAKGGRLEVRVPGPDCDHRWRDPTHLRPYHEDAFHYFDPRSKWFRYGAMYSSHYWDVTTNVGEDGNVTAVMRPRKGDA